MKAKIKKNFAITIKFANKFGQRNQRSHAKKLLTVNKSRRLSFDTKRTFFTVPSGSTSNESSSSAWLRHHETRGAGMPPLAKHVMLKLLPS